MENIVLKEQLRDAIRGRKVSAAVFYSFNFDPRFFENYVMPLLVPSKTFGDEHIYNNILWRRCRKEGLIPPVTVYCDHFAKDPTMAPTLGYDIRCVRLPAGKGAIVNFHPKEIFVLFTDGNILHVNSSANLTPSGWCENLETISIRELPRTNRPRLSQLNHFQQMMAAIANLHGQQVFSDAEKLINQAMNYVRDGHGYFTSVQGDFLGLMKRLVATEKPYLLEVISPYMYGQADLLSELRAMGFGEIRCLVPTLRGSEVLLDREVFLSMAESGVQWCIWEDRKIWNEPRNLHAKIYRLYSETATVTITGSVNFTGPAWRAFTSTGNNHANIESAVIYRDPPQELLLSPWNYDVDQMVFHGAGDPSVTEQTEPELRDAPELEFLLDWARKSLTYTYLKSYKRVVNFNGILESAPLEVKKKTLPLSARDLSHLAKNALIEVLVGEQVYAYYPVQSDIESRPLGFELSPSAVLKFWMFDDKMEEEHLSEELAALVTGEHGEVRENVVEKVTLLNIFAQHFTALNRLEKKLFGPVVPDRAEISYYLLSENLETVGFYLRGLRKQLEMGELGHSFIWMVLRILQVRFYERALAFFDQKGDRANRSALKVQAESLRSEAKLMEGRIEGLGDKSHWVIEQLKR